MQRLNHSNIVPGLRFKLLFALFFLLPAASAFCQIRFGSEPSTSASTETVHKETDLSVSTSSANGGVPIISTSTPAAVSTSSAPADTTAEAPNQFANCVVSDIQFQGNSINKSRSLEHKIKTRRNQPVEKKKLQEDVKILFETGDFDDVSVDITRQAGRDAKGHQKCVVSFTVVERPTIKRIDYKGNTKVHTTSFEEKIQSKEAEPYDKFKASIDEKTILEYYRNEGYAKAQVEHYTSLDAKSKKLILTFFITEGDRVLVKTLSVAGTHRFPEKTILRQMKTRRKKVFKQEVLLEDRKKILDFYKNRGHLDAEVSTPTVNVDEEHNEANIQITITEGPLYKIGNVEAEGYTIFSKKEITKAITLRSRREFQQNKLDETLANINSLYADKGYLRTEVTAEPQRNPQAGTVDFKIKIRESTVVYVDGVYVDGNTYTKDYVIKREVLLKPGDVFSASRMRRSVEKIYNLGFLEDVQVDVQQPRDPNLADLIFSVKEGKPGILSVGAGFSSVDRFVGTIQVSHTNLFGKAQRVDLSYEFGARRQNLDLSFTDPWILGYNMTGGFDLFNSVRVRDFPGDPASFQEKRRGVSLRLGPRLTDDLNLLFTYTIQTTEIFGVDARIKPDLFSTFGIPAEQAPTIDSISQIKSSLISELAFDTRDNKFDATKGTRDSASVEVAGGPFGGDIHFYKPQVTASVYIPTFWKFVFSVSGRAAWVNPFSPSSDVPESERFFLGGPDTIRGYDTNSIVPRTFDRNQFGINETHQIPGRIMAIFNAEYKFPIVQEHSHTIFQGAFFLDVGGTWLRPQDIELATGKTDNRMKAGVGFGFRFKTPVFPIRLDFAVPLNPRGTDTSRQGDSHSLQPYFTIGNIF